MRRLTLTLLPAVLFACDDSATRERDPNLNPDEGVATDLGGAGGGGGAGDPDMTPTDEGVGGGGDAEPDQGRDMFVAPDVGPAEPEICDGQDQDQDGLIDEGVSNACGGCGGLPPEGCQAWRVSLVQNAQSTLVPDGVVGLTGAALGFSEQMIPGALCEILRIPASPVDAHLGQVNVDSPQANLNLGPVYDDRLGAHRYLNTPELGATTVHDAGDAVQVRAGGGLLVGPFDFTLTAPDRLAQVTEDDLAPIADLAQGNRDAPYTLTWAPGGDPRLPVGLFIGGSRPIFRTSVYRGTDSYQIDGRLRDDGEFVLAPELFGGGLPESAIRVDLVRQAELRLPLGSHSVSAQIGQRLRLGRSGPLERDAERPFQITNPSPNVREIAPGEPLLVEWSALPPGAGPLTVTLILQDNAIPERRQISCVVDDPSLNALTLPAEFTAEFWPAGDTDVRILALRWDVFRAELPAPDRGTLVRSQTIQMDLEP
ncbi:MAG: hypothetical protein KC613_08385 [Myxococcales bacterium]|nr:hypothetical protein [Myxococcales bacterium]MCB9523224.1 hypothetical protein [Myxococcales bacterium]